MFELIVNHLLGNIPTWVWPFTAGAGFAAFIISGVAQHIEPVRIYGLVARPISVIIMVLGVFFYGGAGVLEIQAQALAEAKNRIAMAEQSSADANKLLSQTLSNKEHLINGRSYGVTQVIKRDTTAINADCNKINDRAWNDYNRAVSNIGSVDSK